MRDLGSLQGKTIGIVYTYEGEEAPGFSHYHFWRSDIISNWLLAVQKLHCRPFILDVRTFVEKAIAQTLPHLDFVLNLNCGGCELSPMALVPSLCSFFHIPCIPCDANTILDGENKRISNLIARATGLQVPEDLAYDKPNGIFRPLNLGSSIGVERGPILDSKKEGLYQEFIPGYDITTPIVYNPITDKMDFMPTVLYLSKDENTDWYLGEEYKESRSGFTRKTIHLISDDLQKKYLKFISNTSVMTYCRIDARIKCTSRTHLNRILKEPLNSENIYFVELNTMPTVWTNNAFSHSYSEITPENTLYSFIEEITEKFSECNLYMFLLCSSMLSFYNQVKK